MTRRAPAHRARTSRACRGFTLLEVVIAVAILGFALLAVLQTVDAQARAAEHLRRATLAHWVGQNAIAALRLEGVYPEPGTREGSTVQGGRRFDWQLTVQPTEDPDLRRVEVVVADEDGSAADLTTVVGRW